MWHTQCYPSCCPCCFLHQYESCYPKPTHAPDLEMLAGLLTPQIDVWPATADRPPDPSVLPSIPGQLLLARTPMDQMRRSDPCPPHPPSSHLQEASPATCASRASRPSLSTAARALRSQPAQLAMSGISPCSHREIMALALAPRYLTVVACSLLTVDDH